MKLSHKVAAAVAVTAMVGVSFAPANAAGARNRYGGSVYTGKPALTVTASLVKAGGGAANYSQTKALISMLGAKAVNAEVAKLSKQYGHEKVVLWSKVGDFAVKDALKIATKAGVKLPAATLGGTKLASTLVKAGLEKDNTFVVGLMLDKAVTHNIHMQVMTDVDKKFGPGADANYHKISNQAFYDVAHALGLKQVKLFKFH